MTIPQHDSRLQQGVHCLGGVLVWTEFAVKERRKGGREGRREGGREGRREGGKEGRREGGKEEGGEGVI